MFKERYIMNRKFATTALLVGALTLPALALAAGETPATFVKDSVITAKIKAEMIKDPLVSATAIKVDTDANGVVQLSGTAKSKAEAAKAVQIAQSTKGVASVDNKITVPSN